MRDEAWIKARIHEMPEIITLRNKERREQARTTSTSDIWVIALNVALDMAASGLRTKATNRNPRCKDAVNLLQDFPNKCDQVPLLKNKRDCDKLRKKHHFNTSQVRIPKHAATNRFLDTARNAGSIAHVPVHVQVRDDLSTQVFVLANQNE